MKSRCRGLLLFTSLVATHLCGCGVGAIKIYSAIDDDDPKMIASIAKQSKSALNTVSVSGGNPLLHALKEGKKKAFRALLENGADPNHFVRNKWCATFEAARTPDAYWLREVMKHGGDPNLDNHAAPRYRTTTLIQACKDGCLENLKLLVKDYGADVNYICYGEDALISATEGNHFQASLWLLENGSIFRRKTHQYRSFAESFYHREAERIRDDAERAAFLSMVQFLKDNGIQWNKPELDGEVYVYR